MNTERKDRAELDVISARILPAEEKNGFPQIEIAVANRGRATATDVSYWKGLEIIYAENPLQARFAPRPFEQPHHVQLRQIPIFFRAGHKAPLRFAAPIDRPIGNTLVYVYGQLKYIDQKSGWTYRTPWCFSILRGQTGICEADQLM